MQASIQAYSHTHLQVCRGWHLSSCPPCCLSPLTQEDHQNGSLHDQYILSISANSCQSKGRYDGLHFQDCTADCSNLAKWGFQSVDCPFKANTSRLSGFPFEVVAVVLTHWHLHSVARLPQSAVLSYYTLQQNIKIMLFTWFTRYKITLQGVQDFLEKNVLNPNYYTPA